MRVPITLVKDLWLTIELESQTVRAHLVGKAGPRKTQLHRSSALVLSSWETWKMMDTAGETLRAVGGGIAAEV